MLSLSNYQYYHSYTFSEMEVPCAADYQFMSSDTKEMTRTDKAFRQRLVSYKRKSGHFEMQPYHILDSPMNYVSKLIARTIAMDPDLILDDDELVETESYTYLLDEEFERAVVGTQNFLTRMEKFYLGAPCHRSGESEDSFLLMEKNALLESLRTDSPWLRIRALRMWYQGLRNGIRVQATLARGQELSDYFGKVESQDLAEAVCSCIYNSGGSTLMLGFQYMKDWNTYSDEEDLAKNIKRLVDSNEKHYKCDINKHNTLGTGPFTSGSSVSSFCLPAEWACNRSLTSIRKVLASGFLQTEDEITYPLIMFQSLLVDEILDMNTFASIMLMDEKLRFWDNSYKYEDGKDAPGQEDPRSSSVQEMRKKWSRFSDVRRIPSEIHLEFIYLHCLWSDLGTPPCGFQWPGQPYVRPEKSDGY